MALGVSGAGCGSEAIPPVPEELRRLEQREASCAVCHDTGRAAPLGPGSTVTPAQHPPFTIPPDVARTINDAPWP